LGGGEAQAGGQKAVSVLFMPIYQQIKRLYFWKSILKQIRKTKQKKE